MRIAELAPAHEAHVGKAGRQRLFERGEDLVAAEEKIPELGNRLAVQFNMTAMVNDLGTIFANSKKETEAALSENSGDQQEGVKP